MTARPAASFTCAGSGPTLVLGLGNSVRRDDGVGLAVLEHLRRLDDPALAGVVLDLAGTAGLGILELITGFERLVVLDAIDIGDPPGTVRVLSLDELEARPTLHAGSSHEADLLTALGLGRSLGLVLPSEVLIVGIQVADVLSLDESLTPEVAAAVPEAAGTCLELLRQAGQ